VFAIQDRRTGTKLKPRPEGLENVSARLERRRCGTTLVYSVGLRCASGMTNSYGPVKLETWRYRCPSSPPQSAEWTKKDTAMAKGEIRR
jgi:hypothetical protein